MQANTIRELQNFARAIVNLSPEAKEIVDAALQRGDTTGDLQDEITYQWQAAEGITGPGV